MIPNKKSLLIDLIIEDLCMQQFLQGMESLGFTTTYDQRLYKAVARVLYIEPSRIPDRWLNAYCSYYDKASFLPYHDRRALSVLAENCLEELVLI